MFATIEPLLRHCTKLTLSLQMKGDEMVVCVMPQGTAKDAAMLQPLALTAMAAELDAGFVDALAAYSSAHASLAEQVAATTAILEAAKTTQVSKATKTLAKGSSKPALPAPGRSSTDAENDDDDASDSDEGQSTAPSASSASEASAAPADTGTNLASLFD
ncbi:MULTISPECIES: PRTRC system protein E [unclassified Caballeronia]|uniref:PRTRC system protein E n=1 Tax=unclassified Caballeronia TaxID=2646786 RepID=UPI0028551697|nr:MULTISPECIES: PRTRC system protein E [unclassified Caballeronia]MDR5776911.1 PRTRC system protein E [Caballeronia sp. LZ002]MDR5798783.1 PRTRC system protein E [Caballeronia sp. LZ001]MDR5852304.1 PRTRC system protein E [Caballeronia sp. LZ003]